MSGFGRVLGGIFSPRPTKVPQPVVAAAPDLFVQLIKEARSHVGVREHGSNKGKEVERFQDFIGDAQGEAWCMSFVQYCVNEVASYYKTTTGLYKSEHCLTVWRHSPDAIKSQAPFPGAVVIWQHGSSSNGHTGIVTEVFHDRAGFATIEGNTNLAGSSEGDGVYAKERAFGGSGDMKIVGFLRPF